MSRPRSNKFFKKVKGQAGFLFVTALVLYPIFSVWQLAGGAANIDSRKVIKVQPLVKRPLDTGAEPKVFAEPLLSVTFDDGWESMYEAAFPLIQKYGIRTTQYVIAGTTDEENYMSVAQMESMDKAGHDIACHTTHHYDLTQIDQKAIDEELKGCFDKLSPVFGRDSLLDFAAPYGSVNENVLAAIKSRFRSARNTNGDITNGLSDFDVNTEANFDRYNLIAATIRRDTTTDQIKEAIDYARKHNAWLILNYHQIDEGDSAFGLDTDAIDRQLKFISESPIRIITISEGVKARVKATEVTY